MTNKPAGAKAKSRLAMAGVIAVTAATIGLTTIGIYNYARAGDAQAAPAAQTAPAAQATASPAFTTPATAPMTATVAAPSAPLPQIAGVQGGEREHEEAEHESEHGEAEHGSEHGEHEGRD